MSKIKTIRLQKGLTQTELAAKCGLNQGNLSGIERGKRGLSVVNLKRLAKALNCPITALIDLEEESTPCHS